MRVFSFSSLKHLFQITLMIVGIVSWISPVVAAMSGPNNAIDRDVTASGGSSSSPGYLLSDVIGQGSPVGGAQSVSFVVQQGFAQIPPLPMIDAVLNAAVFTAPDLMTVTLNTAPASQPMTADVYVVLKLPNGSQYSLRPAGNLTPGLSPYMSAWSIQPQSQQVFSLTFAGTEPLGNYQWLVAYTQPGTLNVIGAIQSAPFKVQ